MWIFFAAEFYGKDRMQNISGLKLIRGFLSATLEQAVLWIRDIFVWIRIRGSVQLTYGYGSGSCSFLKSPSRCQQKITFYEVFLLIYFLNVHINHFLRR
jgi:hypothetical protein